MLKKVMVRWPNLSAGLIKILIGTLSFTMACQSQNLIREHTHQKQDSALQSKVRSLCEAPCDLVQEKELIHYTTELLEREQAVEPSKLIHQCMAHCPQLTCALEKIYADHPSAFTAREYAENIIKLTKQCVATPPSGFSAKDFLAQTSDQRMAKELLHEVRKKNPALKRTGYAVIVLGSMIMATSIALALSTINVDGVYLALPYPKWQSAVDGRYVPSAIDIRPAYLSILGSGSVVVAVGIVLSTHFTW